MRFFNLAFLLAVLATAFGLYWASYEYFRTQEIEKASARLTVYRSTVEAELLRFLHLPFVLSLDPVVQDTLSGNAPAKLDDRLAQFAESAGVDAIYLMNREGLTISASNAGQPGSFVGQNYGFRPYFRAALNGELGEFYGIGATTGIPGYFYAMAVPTPQETGVIALKVELSALQQSWQSSGDRIILTNADGVVLLASDPAWRYRTLSPLSETQRAQIQQSRQFGRETLDLLEWTANPDRQMAAINGEPFLHLHTNDLPNDWTLHFFAPDDQAVTRAWLAAGFWVLLSVLFFVAYQISRVRQIGAALARSEKEEALLRSANERLAIEVQERRSAEQTLQKTQAELERASRLAALGQLASSVTHELGQPIAAMRNQLAAEEMRSGTSTLTDKMQGLVARMEGITRQLKFFSRKGRDNFEDIDLGAVMSEALELLTPTIEDADALISYTPPDATVPLHGNRLRIEQVMTNLVRNALDAVDGMETRQIEISVGATAEDVWFSVADTGHGLGTQSFEELREPFTTTRESGKGMGLGLTISSGIVADHAGTMTAENRESGGAVFSVRFPRAIAEAAE